MNIDNTVLHVLSNVTTEGNSLKLNGNLDRKLYVSTNKVLELAGGKWNRKEQAHLFDGDASEIMDQIILTGTIQNKKQELGYFPTPKVVVERLMEMADIKRGMLVLEPSAGQGAIAIEIAKYGAFVHCFEIDPENTEKLSGNLFSVAPEYCVNMGDFLGVTPSKANRRSELYDCVVMNPPFAKNVAPRHVLHALGFLKSGGRLVSVMPSGVMFRSDDLNKTIRDQAISIEPLPDDSFAASGTNVNTVIVTLKA